MTSDQNLIPPIRARSPRSAQSLQDEKIVEVRLRTRGPIVGALDINEDATIVSLVKSLRQKNGGLPLVAVVFVSRLSDGGVSAQFIESLRSGFDLRSDAIWAVELSPVKDGDAQRNDGLSVVLDATHEEDPFLLQNLVADLLFFPSQDEIELGRLREFARRAPFVILASGGSRLAELEEIATAVGLGTVLFDADSQVIRVPEPIAPPEELSLGERLRATAVRLSVRRNRRSQFRRALLDLRPQLHATWDREIVEAADHCGWPKWAVQMLPARYVPIVTTEASANAYAWAGVAECFTPQATIVRRFCRDEIVEVDLPLDVARLLEDLSYEIEDCLENVPDGEQAFNGAVLGAVSAKMDELPPARREWRVKMQQFLDRLAAQLIG